MKTFVGSCHCGAVKFEVRSDIEKVLECDCSHCSRKGFLLHFVDTEAFTLLSGSENLSEYFFNKKAIKHLFCKICGVQAFAIGVAFPKVAVNVRCLEGVDSASLTKEQYHGKDA